MWGTRGAMFFVLFLCAKRAYLRDPYRGPRNFQSRCLAHQTAIIIHPFARFPNIRYFCPQIHRTDSSFGEGGTMPFAEALLVTALFLMSLTLTAVFVSAFRKRGMN